MAAIEETKAEQPVDPQAPGGIGGIKGLEGLKIEIEKGGASQDTTKARKGRPSRAAAPPPPTPEEIKKELEPMIDMVIGMANSYFEGSGMTRLNPIQETLIKTGLMGVCLKYNMSLDEQPELLLAGGLLWVGAEKYTEYKRIKGTPKEQAPVVPIHAANQT